MDCPSCGHVNTEDAKFCNECGARLAPQPRLTAAGERRQLTVMFCDLVGSTELASQMDAEDFREVVGTFQTNAGEVIARYGGHIGQYLGDGLLVYFGYPQSHEDDAVRAVRAGLDLLRAFEELNRNPGGRARLAARVGIHTGPVVVGEMGSGARQETQALGATVNIAARVEGAAAPDSVVISETTLRLVPGLFLTESLGAPALKGVTEPLEIHAVLQSTGVGGRLAVNAARLTPLVGREESLASLLAAWDRVQAGAGQAVLIAGEGGVGKSRLVNAFRDQLATQSHSWFECHSTPFAQGSAFAPVVELIERALSLRPSDPAQKKLEHLERSLEEAGLTATNSVQLLAPLLLLPVPDRYPPRTESPALLRKRTIETLASWVLAIATRRPLVLVVEDLHWCDASTIELLGLLIERSTETQILLLLTHRPEFVAPWSEEHASLQGLELNRLATAQAAALVASVAATRPLAATAITTIIERADGMPLYLEELTKAVVEAGSDGTDGELPLPANLQASLMSRLDRLENGKPVAQYGAVLGREFSHALLKAVSHRDARSLELGISELIDAELLYRRGGAGAPTYFFKHALVESAAYESLLRSARRTLHEVTARVLAEQFPDRTEAEPEYAAHHCERGGLLEEAIGHLQRAGERAARRWANADAIGHLRRALGLLDELHEDAGRDRIELGLQLAAATTLANSQGWTYPDAVRAYERAETLVNALGDVPERPRALLSVVRRRITLGDFSDATVELIDSGLSAAESSGDTFLRVWAHQVRGCVHSFRGEFAKARTHLERAIALYDPATHRPLAALSGYDQGPVAEMYASMALSRLGYLDQGLRLSQTALKHAEDGKNPFTIMFTHLGVGFTAGFRGDYEAMFECGEWLIDYCDRNGLPGQRGWGVIFRGRARSEFGEAETAVEEIQQVVDLHRQLGLFVNFSGFLAMLGDCLRLVGRLDAAREVALEGLESGRSTHQYHNEPQLHWLLGELARGRGADSAAEAENHYRRALDVAQQQSSKCIELRAATSLARLWHAEGKSAEARALLAPLYGWFSEGLGAGDLPDAKKALKEIGIA